MVAQISASVEQETIKKIHSLASKEKRSFSSMVSILLSEAVNNRTARKEKSKHIS